MNESVDKKVKLDKAGEVEKSIRKKFHKTLFSRFAKAINDYDMISPNDKIAVCISGGKDSMLMAKLFQELKRHNKFPFELEFLVMDPGYNKKIESLLSRMPKCLMYLFIFLKLISLRMFLILKNLLAIYVLECVGDIYIIKLKN